ncbi:MAG: hypothetical protein HQM10_01930 [Candidatus Riflebacteria bacterium]|nr:hypothetical protein [Candidatus Riflebacteria bacterium]
MNNILNSFEQIRYMVFGLATNSEFPFTGFPQSVSPAEVSIRKILPSQLPEVFKSLESGYEMTLDSEYAFVADRSEDKFTYVRNGNEIFLSGFSMKEADELKIHDFLLLERAFLALWNQRSAVILHASAVVVNCKAVLFSGMCGTGKSTISAALFKRGYDKLFDDRSVVSFDESGLPRVPPGIGKQLLTIEAASVLNLELSGCPKKDGKVFFHKIPKNTHSLPLGCIFFLSRENASAPSIEEIPAMEAIRLVYENFRSSSPMVRDMSKPSSPTRVVEMIRNIPCFAAKLPKDEFSPETVADKVEDLIAKYC